jgi:hypothetical protein
MSRKGGRDLRGGKTGDDRYDSTKTTLKNILHEWWEPHYTALL